MLDLTRLHPGQFDRVELGGLCRLEQVQNYLHLGMVLVLTLLDFTFTSDKINEFSKVQEKSIFANQQNSIVLDVLI